MKVIQVPYCFYPDPVGGTEVYVETLAPHLQKKGIEVVIVAPTEGDSSTYFNNDLKVRRFNIRGKVDELSDLYGEGDVRCAVEFGKILDEERPEIVHLHAFTRAVSLNVLRQARARNIPTIFTYHTPSVSCVRGTLMRWGRYVCDGRLDAKLCAQCLLHSLSLPTIFALAFGSLPISINDMLRKARLSGGIWTAMRMKGLVSAHQTALCELMAEATCIIVVCEWARDLLSRNGVPEERISVIRHGISEVMARGNLTARQELKEGQVKIAYLGRLHPTKGIDVIISALRSLANLPAQLDIYGIVQSDMEKKYMLKLKTLAAGDARVAFKDRIANEAVIDLIKDYHLLAVPSRWLETGPLVVLEAFCAGTPVIGSNLGGIAELVQDGVNGLLIKPDSVEGWKDALKKVVKDKDIIAALRKGIKPVRTIEKMTEEIIDVYKRI